jgi:HEPN domain-containing protein
MKQLSKLQSLVEAAGKPAKSLGKMMQKLADEVEKAGDAVEEIRTKLESAVITDYLKDEGFPATESKAAKTAANAAYKAMKELEEQVLDLYQGIAIHENPDDFDPKDV